MLSDLHEFPNGEGGMHDMISFLSEIERTREKDGFMRDIRDAEHAASADYYNSEYYLGYDDSRNMLYKRAYCMFAKIIKCGHYSKLVASFRELVSGIKS